MMIGVRRASVATGGLAGVILGAATTRPKE
jgi:hypothetical protein